MLSSHGLHVAHRQLGDTLAQIQPWHPPDMDLVLRPQLQSVDGNPEERKRRSSETSRTGAVDLRDLMTAAQPAWMPK
jgi:hypothetical protein